MYSKILIPTDGTALSLQAARHAFELAQSHGAAVVLLSVLEAPYYDVASGDNPDALEAELAQEPRATLASLAAEARGLGLAARTLIRRGEPAAEILATVQAEGVDLLAMAAHSHGPIASLLGTSVSQDILRRAGCPVLVIGEQSEGAQAGDPTAAAGV